MSLIILFTETLMAWKLYIPRGKGAKVRFENNQIKGIGRGLYINSNDNSSSQATINNNNVDSASYGGFYLNRVSGTIESNTLSYCSSDNMQ